MYLGTASNRKSIVTKRAGDKQGRDKIYTLIERRSEIEREKNMETDRDIKSVFGNLNMTYLLHNNVCLEFGSP